MQTICNQLCQTQIKLERPCRGKSVWKLKDGWGRDGRNQRQETWFRAQICLGSYISPCIEGFVVMSSMYKNDLKRPPWLSTLCSTHKVPSAAAAPKLLTSSLLLPLSLAGCHEQAFPPSPHPHLWWPHTRLSATVVSQASTDRPQYVKLPFAASFQRPLLTFSWIGILCCKKQKVNVKGKFKRPSDF